MIEQEITKEITKERMEQSISKNLEQKLLQAFELAFCVRERRFFITSSQFDDCLAAICDYVRLLYREEYGKIITDEEILNNIQKWVK